MRIFAIVLLTMTACRAQSEQAKVEAVLQKMERAEQTGDFNTLLGLFTSKKAGELENLRPYVKARPEARYHAITTFARGDRAVMLVRGPEDGFLTLWLRKEGGEWKFSEMMSRDTAPDPNSVYALAPPEGGAFAKAGSPWDQVAPALKPAEAARQGWQMKTVFDDTYLYIRIESDTEMPAPGSTIVKPPSGWPVLKIGVAGGGEFVLYDAVNVGDQATFDEHGRANSHRAFAAYMIRLERNHHEVFSATAGLDPSELIAVAGRDYDIRIPLETMGIRNSRATKITVGDAQWPNSVLVSVAAQRFPR